MGTIVIIAIIIVILTNNQTKQRSFMLFPREICSFMRHENFAFQQNYECILATKQNFFSNLRK
jgi:hypothetical protein